MLDDARERAKQRATTEADRQANILREELGELAWDTLEEYFPEQAKARRRRQRLRALITGAAIGLGARSAVRWWFQDE